MVRGVSVVVVVVVVVVVMVVFFCQTILAPETRMLSCPQGTSSGQSHAEISELNLNIRTSELVIKQQSQTNTPEACRATERGWNPIVTLEEPGAVHIRQEVPVSLTGADRENSHTQTGHGDHGANKHLLKCNNVTNVTCNMTHYT